MQLLDQLKVYHNAEQRYVELWQGDLTNMPPEEAVDVLVVSAFPNDYTPTPSSLIGALDQKGICLADLAKNKAADLRENFSCWMSEEIKSPNAGIQFKRILCFEPLARGNPSEVVGDIFQSLIPFVDSDSPITSIAMPLVASGDQNVPLADMLEPLFDAAVHWMELGWPVKCMKIVQHSELKAAELKGAFSILKKQYLRSAKGHAQEYQYDIFVSYSHDNRDAVLLLIEELQKRRPNLRVFIDRKNLNSGMAWQTELFEALDNCKKVITVYSPPYLKSKMCKEEFNIALFRHRDSEKGVIVPLYLNTANLPTYMKMVQYINCREGDMDKIGTACGEILARLDE